MKQFSVIILLLLVAVPVLAQRELLPLDHPATRALVRIYEYGGIPTFQREHLPLSRGAALSLLTEATNDPGLPSGLRAQAEYYRVELAADDGTTPTRVVIPTDSASLWIPDHLGENIPSAGIRYSNRELGLLLVADPVLDAQVRTDPGEGLTSLIFQGGAQIRGTIAGRVGFSSRITNGTIVGDTTLPLRDPRFKRSGKLGVIGQGRDIDFGNAHLRLDFDNVAIDLAREGVALGGGAERSLLVGTDLPSNFDWLRLSAKVGKISFSHIHGSLMADMGSSAVGSQAKIPSKYVAAHLLSVGPFAGIRFSLGESLIYSGRPIELGYLNPLNFLKSQEHYLRDRDNSNIYSALSINPLAGIFLEGEFLLDDLRFSQIGEGFWGNKTAWRIGARLTALPVDMLDLGLSLTRLEPYVFTHFNDTNAYTHDGALLAAGGLEPNSYLLEGNLRLIPVPNLRLALTVGIGEHGANEMRDSNGQQVLVRNVGGNVAFTRHAGRDADLVTFLDGVSEEIMRLRLELEYEPIRNIYLRALFIDNSITRADAVNENDRQIHFGVRVGAF